MTDNAAMSAAPSRTAILVAAFDSQLKWAYDSAGAGVERVRLPGDRAK